MEKVIKKFIFPIILIVTGIVCNLLVIKLNHGMPIIGNSNEYSTGIPLALNKVYVTLNSNTILPFLGDTIYIGSSVISIGDLLIWTGLTAYIIILITVLIKRKTYEANS